MGPNWKEQGKYCKKPAEQTAGSQQNTPVFPESFPDVNLSCHSPWSILRMTGRTIFQYQLPSFLNDCTNIFPVHLKASEKKKHTLEDTSNKNSGRSCLSLLSLNKRRDLTNCSNSPVSPILLHLVNGNIHFNFSMIFLSYTKLHNVSHMTLAVLTDFTIERNIWNIFDWQLETIIFIWKPCVGLKYKNERGSLIRLARYQLIFSYGKTYRFPSASESHGKSQKLSLYITDTIICCNGGYNLGKERIKRRSAIELSIWGKRWHIKRNGHILQLKTFTMMKWMDKCQWDFFQIHWTFTFFCPLILTPHLSFP